MKDQDILGMDSALAAAKEMPYGANMPISAGLVIEMVERIAELEKRIALFARSRKQNPNSRGM